MTNSRPAGVYSAAVPGVMGAQRAPPLGRTRASSRLLGPAPSAPPLPLRSLMQKTGLFKRAQSPGVKVPLGDDVTVRG